MTKFNLDKLREIAEPRKLSRAEEMALEAYPRDEDKELNYRRANYRIAYERGYKQAEKDLAPTWEDMKAITDIADKMMEEIVPHHSPEWLETEEKYYTEVLKRYLEAKK